MNEATLTQRQARDLATVMAGGFWVKHHDTVTEGVADSTWTWNKVTVWLEFKFADPDFEVRPAQKVFMMRMAIPGVAFFVIFERDAVELRDPRTLEVIERYQGHDTYRVATYIRKTILAIRRAA